MLTIKALSDGEDETLTCLGALCPLENEPSDGIRFKKKINVNGIGSYTKKLFTPIYKSDAMNKLSVTDPNRSFDYTHCLGALCPGVSMKPKGYVTRSCGAHRFCLPVYEAQSISSAFYCIAGYMVTDGGFVAVTRRRTMLWVMLGLCAAVTFILTYLILEYGANEVPTVLTRFINSFFQQS